MRTSRITRGFGAAMLLVVIGGSSATAMSYGSASNPMRVSNGGLVRGQGYGTFTAANYNQAKLTATLSDSRRDDTRTYSEGKAYGSNDYVKVQSGRRADGETAFVAMKTKYGTATRNTSGWTANVKLCQDRSGPDWCTQETTAHGRL